MSYLVQTGTNIINNPKIRLLDVLHFINDITSDKQSIFKLFSKYLQSVYGDAKVMISSYSNCKDNINNTSTFVDNLIESCDLYSRLKKRNPNKFQVRYYSSLAFKILLRIYFSTCFTFKKSLISGIFPTTWKRAILKLIYKSVDKSSLLLIIK